MYKVGGVIMRGKDNPCYGCTEATGRAYNCHTLCTLIPPMDDYRGHNMYLCGKRDGFNECVQMLKDNLESINEEQGHES